MAPRRPLPSMAWSPRASIPRPAPTAIQSRSLLPTSRQRLAALFKDPMSSLNWRSFRATAAIDFVVAVVLFLAGNAAGAQNLAVLPVNVFLQPGQRTATLSVTNSGNKPTSIQVRAYDW